MDSTDQSPKPKRGFNLQLKIHAVSKINIRRPIYFLVGGLINTGITYVLFLILTNFTSYQISYAIAYVVGIILGFFINTGAVFKTKKTWTSFATYPLVYLIQYLISAGALHFFVEKLAIPASVAPIIITAFLVPITYLSTKYILKPNSPI